MQSKLELVLEDKEGELKLHQRFLNLRALCEEHIFPSTKLPLKRHVEELKGLVEKIIPDPRDRKEELFSGEIFALLGAIYLHDSGLATRYKGFTNDEIFKILDSVQRKLLVTHWVGKELDFPEGAIEIIDYLSFSNAVKKGSLEWAIVEEGNKAIIRNAKVLQYVFNFSHLLLDIFFSDFKYPRLRRYSRARPMLNIGNSQVDISSREGLIYIGYHAKFPYELHQVERVKLYVDNAFKLFKNNVNGRLGFQYKEIVWNITSEINGSEYVFEGPRFSPCSEEEMPLLDRWNEASIIMDKLFEQGSVMVVGEESIGKSTILRSFVLPQLSAVFSNVFYCELWGKPVDEIRDAVGKKDQNQGYSGRDIISICKRLLEEGPCFFILDACERLITLEQREREKFERFLSFSFGREDVYLIMSGDKESFFDWFTLFKKMSLSAIYEIPPIESELLFAGLDFEEVLERALKGVQDKDELRGILGLLTDLTQNHLRRHSIDSIRFETCIPRDRLIHYLDIIKKAGIVKETELSGAKYFSLSSRYLRDPLCRMMNLTEFEEKKSLRNKLQNFFVNDSLLDGETLEMVRKWMDRMIFSKEGMGLILSSLISREEDCALFLEKAREDDVGVEIQPILKFINSDDARKRKDAIKVLVEIQDKKMVNPLLKHLKRENVQEIKDLLVEGMGRTGKKRTIVAVMDTLRELGDRSLRIKMLEFFRSPLDRNAKALLLEMAKKENDPVVLEEINRLLATQES